MGHITTFMNSIFEIGNKVSVAAYLTRVFSGPSLLPWVGMKPCKKTDKIYREQMLGLVIIVITVMGIEYGLKVANTLDNFVIEFQ